MARMLYLILAALEHYTFDAEACFVLHCHDRTLYNAASLRQKLFHDLP